MSHASPSGAQRERLKRKAKARRKSKRRDRKRRRSVIEEYGDQGYWSCGRKNRYKTKELADAVAFVGTMNSGIEISTYKCKLCGGWHLTSHPRKEETGETVRGVRQVEDGGEEAQEDTGRGTGAERPNRPSGTLIREGPEERHQGSDAAR